MEDNKLTEFEEKALEGICRALGYDRLFPGYKSAIIYELRQIMPPTCTPNERKFLDEIKIKGFLEKNDKLQILGDGIYIGRHSKLLIEDFDSDLSELVGE